MAKKKKIKVKEPVRIREKVLGDGATIIRKTLWLFCNHLSCC